MTLVRFISCVALCAGLTVAAYAQGTQVALGTPATSPDEEVEITSDTLNVNRETGEAVFVGSVVVTQGALKLVADEVVVFYAESTQLREGGITEVNATGNVVFVSGPDTAEGARATYKPDSQELRIFGDVLLTQGPVIVAGDALVMDLATGIGEMEGRVRTILQPAAQ
ncbi:LptA/OstA family protein [Tropicimonas sp. S265A]|uniref:LptA/OstA family protein n=1 Tax=Tropicimonas sp. S265A TaxID=3415134 RepID=UPI003C7B289C